MYHGRSPRYGSALLIDEIPSRIFPSRVGGLDGSGVRKIKWEESPSMVAAIAVARAWFDCAPPQVSTVSVPHSSASANTDSNFRILLPERLVPVRSSRLMYNMSPFIRIES